MTEELILKLALAAAIFVALLALLGWSRSRTRASRQRRARFKIARAAETEAESLLAKFGYEVVDRQVTRTWRMIVDGQAREVSCRADLVVRRRRDPAVRFVAEVKTGSRVTQATHPATRRQLLEYSMVFDVDGVLLLDMDRRRIHTVEFPTS